MDISCPRCGEPVEVDYLHDVADRFDTTYQAIKSAFASIGCAVLDDGPDAEPTCEESGDIRAIAMQACIEMSDDPGDWASDMEDFEAMGMLQ